jgi:hypothetical protein
MPSRTSIGPAASGSHRGVGRTARSGKPTGRTRALAEASRDRHIDAAKDDARLARLTEGFHAQSTLAEPIRWWLDHIARHNRVRITTWATYSKQLKLVEDRIGEIPVRQLRPEQVTTFVSELVDRGSAARARHARTLLVQVLDAPDLSVPDRTEPQSAGSGAVHRNAHRTGDESVGARLTS